jgi:hypothetical protein
MSAFVSVVAGASFWYRDITDTDNGPASGDSSTT